MAGTETLVMPKFGLTMTEGTVVEWPLGEGAEFEAGATIVVIETDKVANEVQATAAGRLTRILVQVSETVPVGTPIAEWETLGEAVASGPAVKPAAVADVARSDTIEVPSAAALVAARRMTESKQTIPHFYLSLGIDTTALQERRSAWNQGRSSGKATLTHAFLFALARAMQANPDLNRVWANEGEIRVLPTVDIGLAVQTPEGLRAPVIPNAAAMSLEVLVAATDRVVERAMAARLTAVDSGPAAVTLSNAGVFGVDSVVSIINPGQAMILGIGRQRPCIRLQPTATPVAGMEITATLSCDHRVMDGKSGARVLCAVRDILENPEAVFV